MDDSIMLATDLDNTLIHSYKHRVKGDICIELLEGKEQSFMGENSLELLEKIKKRILVVPVTTRSLAQYLRLDIFKSSLPKYAFTTNGAILLESGEPSEKWNRGMRNLAMGAKNQLDKAMEIFSQAIECSNYKIIDGIFAFSITTDPQTTYNRLLDALDDEEIFIYKQGRKIYAIPRGVKKGDAVKSIKDLLQIKTLICAGDSSLDIEMLNEADIAIVPSDDFKKKIIAPNIIIFDQKGSFEEFMLRSVASIIGL